MNQPNFDEMDALMGEGSGARSRESIERIVDVEPSASTNRNRKVKKNPNRGLIVALFAIGIIVAMTGPAYLVFGGSHSAVVASPEVIAATLGANAPPAGAQRAIPGPTLTEGAEEQESVAAPVAAPLAAAAIEADQARAAAEAELKAKMSALEAELQAAKTATSVAEHALEAAKNKPAAVVTRDAATSFVLVETLIDGAVLRDKGGNEVIVPRGGAVQVAGNKLAVGGGQ